MNQNELYHAGVLGMKWGVRRYQDKDGTLTDAGKKRYDRDQRENQGKDPKKADPNRWVREDTERTKKTVDAATGLTKELSKELAVTKKQKLDLSKTTDQEMREKINRAMLEKQYNDMFAPEEKVAKGQKYVENTFAAIGTVLAVTSSALGIALAIRELKG